MTTHRLRVGLHRFQTYRRHGGRDGANFAYAEIGRLLDGADSVEVIPHDIVQLAASDVAAQEALADCDVVVAAVGPHAYLYFYLRERLGLRFRILRDVRTALWNGYLLQEFLVGPYLRAEDSVVYSSVYSRDLFRFAFPEVPWGSQHICYPLLHWFPRELPARSAMRKADVCQLGYVGRLTDDKNFPQVLEVFAELRRRGRSSFELCAVGEGQHPYGAPKAIDRILRGDTRGFRWVPPVSRDEIWKFYRAFDVLLFPSTSTLETFGRVLVEASYAGTPVLASDHGAASELLDPHALTPTSYFANRWFTAQLAAPLGKIEVDAVADRLTDGAAVPVSTGHERYRRDPARFLSLVRDGNDVLLADSAHYTGTAQQHSFLARLQMRALPRFASMASADTAIRKLRWRFVALNRRGPEYPLVLLELLVRSRYRRRTTRFLRMSLLRGEDFTNIGGIDLQFSHILGFYPAFRLVEP